MSEPITCCIFCGDPFDVYRAEDDRVCEGCAEAIAATDSEPCTQLARDYGCTCRMSQVHSNDIDPPEPVIDRDCPIHGPAPDPDYELERQRDDERA